MKTIFIFFSSFFCGASLFCQPNLGRNWFFGTNAGLTFTNGAPTTTPNGAITYSIDGAAISGTNGALLFYTDGTTIYNQTHSVMANGTGLHGAGASQSSIILKQPGNTNLYYVFTVGTPATGYGLEYSIVDMNLASGLGSVTVKCATLNTSSQEVLTAGKHCNGNDL